MKESVQKGDIHPIKCKSRKQTKMKHLFFLFLVTLTLSSPGQVPGDTLTLDSSLYVLPPVPAFSPGQIMAPVTLKNRSGWVRTVPSPGNYTLTVISSTTCPIYTAQAMYIDQWLSTHPYVVGQFVMTMEAHPDTIPGETFKRHRHGSAYPVLDNITTIYWPWRWVQGNRDQGIQLPNPVTYGDRIAHGDTLAARWNPALEILIDDPSNTAWKAYAYTPAAMYLTDPTGVVLYSGHFFNFMPSQGEPTRHALDDALQTSTGIAAPVGDGVHLIEFDGYRWEWVTERKGNRMYKLCRSYNPALGVCRGPVR